jgi:hypothetical protein
VVIPVPDHEFTYSHVLPSEDVPFIHPSLHPFLPFPFIGFILFSALPKKVFPLSKWGAGAKAIGKAKGILGGKSLTIEIRGKGKINVEWPNVGGPQPIPPRKLEKNGTRPRALKIHPTQNGRGISPLCIGLRNMVIRGFFFAFGGNEGVRLRQMHFFRQAESAAEPIQADATAEGSAQGSPNSSPQISPATPPPQQEAADAIAVAEPVQAGAARAEAADATTVAEPVQAGAARA